jgi:hypothetical protein
LLKDLKAETLPQEYQQQIVGLVSERFNKVVMITLLRLLNDEQRGRLEQAIGNSDKLGDTIEKLAAEVPDLHLAIEQALLAEYEALKAEMA